MNRFQKIVATILFAAAAVTILFGIYMAHPWDDNYAYQRISDYFVLVGLLMFAISPYLGFLFIPRLFRENSKATITFLVGAVIIATIGIYFLFDVAFLHPDAQGGLFFIFLPIYQWMATAVLAVICLFIKRLGSPNA